jgi:LacI family transcriptional regulator
VSVVSFDDDLLASWVRPQLTSVALPHYELGRQAINVLLDMDPEQSKQGDGRQQICRIPMPLRERESVRRLAKGKRPTRVDAGV